MATYVSRVNQIDAAQLDNEIFKVLRNQVKKITKYAPPGKLDKWQPELDAVLRFFVWFLSLKNGKSTFGQQLLNLRYIGLTNRKAVLYLILTCLPKYLKDKAENAGRLFSNENNDKIKSYVEHISKVISFLEIASMLIFLHRGTQPFLIERLLGISSQHIVSHKPRDIGYSYMTRELIWHGLMELFSMGLPMINYHYLLQTIRRFWQLRKKKSVIRVFPVMDEFTNCAYCEERPILPVHAGCEHIFCYYCLKAHFTAMTMYMCPLCDTELHADNMKYYEVITRLPSRVEEE